MLRRHIKIHDLTYKKVGVALGCDQARINNLVGGKLYPTPDECDALERLFGLPVETMFEESMLVWRYDWPPRNHSSMYGRPNAGRPRKVVEPEAGE